MRLSLVKRLSARPAPDVAREPARGEAERPAHADGEGQPGRPAIEPVLGDAQRAGRLSTSSSRSASAVSGAPAPSPAASRSRATRTPCASAQRARSARAASTGSPAACAGSPAICVEGRDGVTARRHVPSTVRACMAGRSVTTGPDHARGARARAASRPGSPMGGGGASREAKARDLRWPGGGGWWERGERGRPRARPHPKQLRDEVEVEEVGERAPSNPENDRAELARRHLVSKAVDPVDDLGLKRGDGIGVRVGAENLGDGHGVETERGGCADRLEGAGRGDGTDGGGKDAVTIACLKSAR